MGWLRLSHSIGGVNLQARKGGYERKISHFLGRGPKSVLDAKIRPRKESMFSLQKVTFFSASQVLPSGFNLESEKPERGLRPPSHTMPQPRVVVMPAIPEPRPPNQETCHSVCVDSCSSPGSPSSPDRFGHLRSQARQRNFAVRSSPAGVWRNLIASFLMGVESCLACIAGDLLGRKLPKCST